MTKRKILLDTDIGTDIDDAFCLSYLLSNPDCELLGITTVSGESEKRAMIASALCIAAQEDVPIYPGLEEPLFTPQKQPFAPQAVKLVNWEHKNKFPKGQAIDFLRKTIREHPGEITLLAIGPLTNIAVLFIVDPEIPAFLKELVLMAGYFKNDRDKYGYEWNINCDPFAAKKVYSTKINVHRSVGLDVTLKVNMGSTKVRKKLKAFNSKVLEIVLDLAEVWFEKNNYVTFHDPLAAVTILESNVCTFGRGTVNVSINQESIGGTWFNEDESGIHEVALDVRVDQFFDSYFSVFNKSLKSY